MVVTEIEMEIEIVAYALFVREQGAGHTFIVPPFQGLPNPSLCIFASFATSPRVCSDAHSSSMPLFSPLLASAS